MAFTVQTDGPVVLGANSYVDLTFFGTYCADRGFDLTPFTTQMQQASLVNASIWVDGHPWVGLPSTYDQDRLGWPRTLAFIHYPGIAEWQMVYNWTTGPLTFNRDVLIPDDIVPLKVRQATCIVAQQDLTERVNVPRDIGQALKMKKVGPITKEWTDPTWSRRYPLAEQLLDGFWRQPTGPGRISLVPG